MTTYAILCGLSGRKLLKTPTGHMKIDCRTSVVDPLFGQRDSFLGKHDLPTKNLTETIKETEKHLVEYPTYLIGWSFGGLIASLQKRSKPIKKVILVSPLSGRKTIVLSPTKRILIQFIPALREAYSEETQNKVFENLKKWNVEIVFILPKNGEYIGDNKVVYSEEVIKRMKGVGTVTFIEGVQKHEEMLSNEQFLKCIKEVID